MINASTSRPPSAGAGREALLVEPIASSAHRRCWESLGYRLHPVEAQLLDSFETDPPGLARAFRARLMANSQPALLILACDGLPAQPVAATADWEVALHKPLTRCFTAVRALVPWVMGQAGGGHIVALLPRLSLFPDATAGSAAVLGRSLLGLLEALRAELRETPTRVTICITDPGEPAEVLSRRIQHVTRRRPFHALPASIDPHAIESYFAPMLAALERTPHGVPLPAGPRGEVYDVERLEDSRV